MTYIMQDKLKYIFSNNNILLNSLKFCKKNNIGNSYLEYIKLSIDKFLACRDISKENLKPGDIVFFRPDEKNNHTAVYLGDTLFINASTSKGVVISTLENTYWNKYFKYGVRVRTV